VTAHTTLVVAHRTCPLDAPENSIAGIAHAAGVGADLVELDVRRTRDGVPVLMHDRTAWRTAGAPVPVLALTAAHARRLRHRRSDAPVPTLGDALRELPCDLGLAVDVKHASATTSVVAAIRTYGLAGRAAIWSERLRALRTAAREAPEIETALLRDTTSPRGLRRFLDDAAAVGAHGISAHWSVVTREFVTWAHGRGLRVFSWCEERGAHRDKLDVALDGIVTEWPALVRESLGTTEARA
jgi:glycerophosphoryl diester phosphodiesterase